MKSSLVKYQLVMFVVMVIVGVCFNPMNILAYRFSDLYLSQTLVYGGILMASNMIWAHELVHLIAMNHCNYTVMGIGVVLSLCVSVFLLRSQWMIDDTQWLRRMISHHSTALTTSHNINKHTKDPKVKKLAKEIIDTQEREISQMKDMIIQ